MSIIECILRHKSHRKNARSLTYTAALLKKSTGQLNYCTIVNSLIVSSAKNTGSFYH